MTRAFAAPLRSHDHVHVRERWTEAPSSRSNIRVPRITGKSHLRSERIFCVPTASCRQVELRDSGQPGAGQTTGDRAISPTIRPPAAIRQFVAPQCRSVRRARLVTTAPESRDALRARATIAVIHDSVTHQQHVPAIPRTSGTTTDPIRRVQRGPIHPPRSRHATCQTNGSVRNSPGSSLLPSRPDGGDGFAHRLTVPLTSRV